MARQSDGRRSVDRRKRGPTHVPSIWAGALSILLLSLIASIRLLGDMLYQYPANPDLQRVPNDALIVCLAGGKFRVEAAYSLFSQGVGHKLLIIGAGKKSTASLLAKAHGGKAAENLDSERFRNIEVETDSRNTVENAFAVGRYLQKNPGVKSLVLITSGYHMRRAQVMIQSQVNEGVTIIPYTPPSEAIEAKNWWHTWVGIEVTTVEYIKFLLASLLMPQLSSF